MAISLGQQGQWTLEQIGEILKRSRATIIRWVRAYREGGVKGLVERQYEGERRKPSLRGGRARGVEKGAGGGQVEECAGDPEVVKGPERQRAQVRGDLLLAQADESELEGAPQEP